MPDEIVSLLGEAREHLKNHRDLIGQKAEKHDALYKPEDYPKLKQVLVEAGMRRKRF